MGEQLMSTMTMPMGSEALRRQGRPMLFPGIIGFYFGFRVCLTFLFFQADPVAGTIVNITVDLALLYGSILYSIDDREHVHQRVLKIPPVCWVLLLLSLSLTSVLWTGTASIVAALAYWADMAADVAIVLLLCRRVEALDYAEAVMKGAIWGAVALAFVAWCSPTTADLRLGNDVFLHPNTLGPEIAIGTLIAQYLAPRGVRWKWLGIALAITLLRTLSKTTIIAFAIAECWYLMRTRQMTRKTKAYLVVGALLVIASFWGLVNSYLSVYTSTGSGNQAETLTGRTLLWTVALSMGLEKPWFGHGLYSFKSLIPAFGLFEPVEAHNELLQQFFEFGIAGVVIALGVYWSFWRQARSAPASDLRALALTLLIFAVLHGLTDTVPFGLSFPLWLLTALSLCLASTATVEAHCS
jgi:exopolysaccharide production protein ExoQ